MWEGATLKCKINILVVGLEKGKTVVKCQGRLEPDHGEIYAWIGRQEYSEFSREWAFLGRDTGELRDKCLDAEGK